MMGIRTDEGPARDSAARKVFELVHVLALGLWLGGLVLAGASAAIVFPAMRDDLQPVLPAYAAYDGSHADIAAGYIQNRVFFANDVVQLVCGVLALGSVLGLILVCKLPIRRWSSALRLCGLGIALGLASYWLMVLAPSMQTDLKAFWEAAAAGENEAASRHKAAFGRDHPTASNILVGTAAAVAVTLCGAAWSACSATSAAPTRRTRSPSPGLEEPKLARPGASA